MSFIKYLGSAHLDYRNVALYDTGVVRAESVGAISNTRCYGRKKFDSPEEAEAWFDALPGMNNVSRLASALEILGAGEFYEDSEE